METTRIQKYKIVQTSSVNENDSFCSYEHKKLSHDIEITEPKTDYEDKPVNSRRVPASHGEPMNYIEKMEQNDCIVKLTNDRLNTPNF